MSFAHYMKGKALAGSPLNTRGIRLGQWKYTKYSDGEEELYNLKADPLEMDSLQHVAADRPILLEMRKLFKRYENCKGRQCWAPLPPRFRLSPGLEKALTLHEIQATDRYYGNPPLTTPAGRVPQ